MKIFEIKHSQLLRGPFFEVKHSRGLGRQRVADVTQVQPEPF
jgi:hypothetical protein